MNKKSITILILATLALSIPAAAQAQYGPRAHRANSGEQCSFAEMPGRPAMPGTGILRHRETLGLTDTQVEQIQQLANQYRAAFELHRTAAQSSRDALGLQLKEKNYDEAALRRAIDAAHPFRVEGMLLRARFRTEVHAILSEEQSAKLDSFDRSPRNRGNRENPSETRGFRQGKRNAEGRGLRGPAA